jgi:hypothetical protein
MTELMEIVEDIMNESDSSDDEVILEYLFLSYKTKTFRPRVLEMECSDDNKFELDFVCPRNP